MKTGAMKSLYAFYERVLLAGGSCRVFIETGRVPYKGAKINNDANFSNFERGKLRWHMALCSNQKL